MDTYLQALQTLLDQTVPHCRHIGLRVLKAQRGQEGLGAAVMQLKWREDLVGDPDNGSLHHGALTTLADTTGGLAIYTSLPTGTPLATLDLRLDYLKPSAAGGTLLCHAQCLKRTQKVFFMRAEIYQGPADLEDSESDWQHSLGAPSAAPPLALATGSYIITSLGFAPSLQTAAQTATQTAAAHGEAP